MSRHRTFWNKRVQLYGHTGWSNRYLYDFDQKARLAGIEGLMSSIELEYGTAVDFGTGAGDFAAMLAGRFRKVIAFDISDAVIARARDRYNSCSNVEFISEEDIFAVDLPRGKIDLILSVTVLDHIVEDQELLRTMKYFRELLSQTGKLVALEYAPDRKRNAAPYQRFMPFESWRDLFEKSGMELREYFGFYDPLAYPCPSYQRYARPVRRAVNKVLHAVNPEWAIRYRRSHARRILEHGRDMMWPGGTRPSELKIMVAEKMRDMPEDEDKEKNV